MKILLIVDDYMPHSIKVAAKMMHELAVELLLQGHQVSVLTPDYNISKKIDILELDGITIYRFRSGEIKNVSKVKRAVNETLLSFLAWRYTGDILKQNKHDLIIYYSPSIFFAPLVYKIKKLWNAKTYLVLRDFFPQWAIDNNILKKKSLITFYFKYFEKLNYKVADTIGVMSGKNLQWFKAYSPTAIPKEVLYNWAKSTKSTKSTNKYRKLLGLEDKVVYFYGGNLGYAQDMINIIRLAKRMNDEGNAHFVLVGEGDEVELIKQNIKNENLINMTLLPSVSQDEYKQMLVEFDIGLFTLNRNHSTHNFPGKLLGYMVEGLPILGSINFGNDLKILLEEVNAGFVSINGEDTLFYENAKALLNLRTRKDIGMNAKKLLLERFSVESAARQILNSVKKHNND